MKDKLTLKNLMYALTVVLGLVTVLLMFGSAVVAVAEVAGKTVSSTAYTGVQVTFGEENVFAFSFMNFLPYILVFAGIVLAVLKFLGVLKSKIVDYILIALFVIAAVLFFLAPNMIVFANNVAELLFKGSTLKLGAGAIVAGIVSILAAASVAVSAFVLKGKNK